MYLCKAQVFSQNGKKEMVNVICNELNISTCGVANNKKDSAVLKESWLTYLQKLNNWTISQFLEMDIQIIKQFLIGSGYNRDKVKKYKTLPSWQHKARYSFPKITHNISFNSWSGIKAKQFWLTSIFFTVFLLWLASVTPRPEPTSCRNICENKIRKRFAGLW